MVYCVKSYCFCPLRWVTGEWEDCSASCGQTGWQRRSVSCQQTSSRGQQQLRSVHSKLCGEDRPDGKQTCNRFPCPAAWRGGPWTPVWGVKPGDYSQSHKVILPPGATFFHSELPVSYCFPDYLLLPFSGLSLTSFFLDFLFFISGLPPNSICWKLLRALGSLLNMTLDQ